MSMSHAYYGSSSPESLPVTPEKKWGSRGPNHVRVMLLHDNRTMVLMCNTGDGWDLPLFKYKSGILCGIRSRRVCRDFTDWFGHEIPFVFVVELLGDMLFSDNDFENDPDGILADLKLVVIEHPYHTRIDSMAPPDGACWKDAKFISNLLETMGTEEEEERVKPFETVLRCIQPGSTVLSSIAEPRHQLGWFKQASNYLESLVNADGAEVQGPVVQDQASFTSTVLVAKTSGRRYFLKAPARGSNETQITAKISSLFEGCTPEVVGTSSELGCFVTKEFITGKLNEKSAIDTLGRIHLKSLSYIEELKQAGCVVRDLNDIRDQVKRWADGYHTERLDPIRSYIGQCACYLMYLCRRLGELKIPLTLVHGDFSFSNVGYDSEDSENAILFDWEFACISHPFLDFFMDWRQEDRDKLSEDLITAYLEIWTNYEDIATLREAFTMGIILGHILRIWSLWDRASVCEHQVGESSLQSWMEREVNLVDCSLRKVIPADEGYQGSPEAKLESEMEIMRW